MAVAWIGTVGFAMALTLVEMGLEWAAPEDIRGVLRPVVFTLASLMARPRVLDGYEVRVTASIGIARCPAHGANGDP